MNATQLLQKVERSLVGMNVGLEPAYIEGFFRRHRLGLVRAIQAEFDKQCNPQTLVPGIEVPVGEADLPPGPGLQQAFLGRDVGSSRRVRLAVKARCHPFDPKVREYAVHSRREDETTWRIHPGEEWHPIMTDAIEQFAIAHALESRWKAVADDGKTEFWYGPPSAPYVLTHEVAYQSAELHIEALEEGTADERKAAEKWHEQDRLRDAAPLGSVPPEPPAASEHTVTKWGGQRGVKFPRELVKKGMRVVTEAGEHGVVSEVSVLTMQTGIFVPGAVHRPTRVEYHYSFHIQLDSGRTELSSDVYVELKAPAHVIPDVPTEDGVVVSPDSAWSAIRLLALDIESARKHASQSRKPASIEAHRGRAEHLTAKLRNKIALFLDWRLAHPDVQIEHFTPQRLHEILVSAGLKGHDVPESERSRPESDGRCRELSFELPPFGLIRVVCGARGRRDQWDNVHVGGTRFGFNGGRWARGMVPPTAVLEEIRRRGITTFSGTTERLVELETPVQQIVRLGGLESSGIRDITPEFRKKARGIPGFLRRDGKSWLELAQEYYGPEVRVVTGAPDYAAGEEGVEGYMSLVNYSLGEGD